MLPLALQPYAALIRAGLWIAAVSALLIIGFWLGMRSERGNTQAVQAKFDTYKAKMVSLTEQVAQAAKRARQEYDDKSAEAQRNYEDGRKSAENRESVVAADLRAGNLRLRSEWAACMSTTRKDQAGPAVGSNDGAAAVPPEAFARVLRVGDDADNQVVWLQAQLMATRNLAESCGVVR